MAHIALLIPDMRGGGAERVALNLIMGFIERGHEVDLVLLQVRGELLELLPSEVRIVDLRADRIRNAIRRLARYLRAENPSGLIAIMWPLPVIAIISRALARAKTHVVASDHAILTAQYNDHFSKLGALWLTTRLFYPFADRRVAASTGIADDLAEISGLSRSRFEVIPNPISLPPTHVEIESSVEQAWGAEGARILSVGSLKTEKNHALLLHAFASLTRRIDASLIILGDGEMRGDLENLARQLGIADRVTLPGFMLDPWPYYASADLFALSSSTEGFGNVLIEALAVGLPVVSTDVSGPRELLGDGEFGTLVPPGDADALCQAMAEQLSTPVDMARLKRRAREFHPEVAVQGYLDATL